MKATIELIKRLEEAEIAFTTNIDEAIYILEDGSLIDGVYDMGMRSEDHRCIEAGIDLNRYDSNMWEVLHDTYKVVRLVPETRYALIKQGQELNEIQIQLLSLTDYEIEEY